MWQCESPTTMRAYGSVYTLDKTRRTRPAPAPDHAEFTLFGWAALSAYFQAQRPLARIGQIAAQRIPRAQPFRRAAFRGGQQPGEQGGCAQPVFVQCCQVGLDGASYLGPITGHEVANECCAVNHDPLRTRAETCHSQSAGCRPAEARLIVFTSRRHWDSSAGCPAPAAYAPSRRRSCRSLSFSCPMLLC